MHVFSSSALGNVYCAIQAGSVVLDVPSQCHGSLETCPAGFDAHVMDRVAASGKARPVYLSVRVVMSVLRFNV